MERHLARRINGALLDITGVLKEGNESIPGSVEAVKRLQQANISIKYVTNETQCTRLNMMKKLNSLGFNIMETDIVAPCPVIVKMLRSQNLRPHLLVHPNVLPEFMDIEQTNPNCVVIGDAGDCFTYEALNEAFKVLKNVETPKLFSLGKGKYYREKDDLMLDVGSYAVMLEYAVGMQADVIGKPSADMFLSALKQINVPPEEAVMIGDDIVGDVGGAQVCGILGVLVRTGKYRPSDENHATVKPNIIADNLLQAVNILLQ